MHIAVLGTGGVGRAIAGRLHELGHDVTVGTRDPQATLARTEPDAMGNAPFATWHADRPGVALATYADAAAGAELVVLATSGAAALEVLALAGADAPGRQAAASTSPTRSTSRTASRPRCSSRTPTRSASRCSAAFPEAKVVKTLNTLNADLMVHPQTLGASSTVFVSGDDAAAKATVTGILTSFGHDDVVDLGGIETARGTEMYLPLWLRLMGALGTRRSTSRSSADRRPGPSRVENTPCRLEPARRVLNSRPCSRAVSRGRRPRSSSCRTPRCRRRAAAYRWGCPPRR